MEGKWWEWRVRVRDLFRVDAGVGLKHLELAQMLLEEQRTQLGPAARYLFVHQLDHLPLEVHNRN